MDRSGGREHPKGLGAKGAGQSQRDSWPELALIGSLTGCFGTYGNRSLGLDSETGKQLPVTFGLGISGSQQLVAIKDGIGSSEEAKRLERVIHALAASRKSNHASWQRDPCNGNSADKLEWLQCRTL